MLSFHLQFLLHICFSVLFGASGILPIHILQAVTAYRVCTGIDVCIKFIIIRIDDINYFMQFPPVIWVDRFTENYIPGYPVRR